MGLNNREIEVKLEVGAAHSLHEVNVALRQVLEELDVSRYLLGNSTDTYWSLPESVSGQFLRMRERDGIRQITVKGVDRDSNLDRMEIDIDSTSESGTIRKLLLAALGNPVGRIEKTYHVYWLGRGKHTTVCCYTVSLPDTTHLEIGLDGRREEVCSEHPRVFVEIETTNLDRLRELETKVQAGLRRYNMSTERAPGSLYEMFLKNK